MAHSIADDVRLRATEAQMRRALGLQDAGPRSRGDDQRSPTITAHRSPRRFVRDGEVPVTLVHRDQTRLAKECFAKDDAQHAAHRSAAEVCAVQQTLRAVQDELLGERLARQNAEQEREDLITTRTIG